MIRATITETEFHFKCLKSGKRHTLRCADHPEVFGHPRHLVVEFERAFPLLQSALRAVGPRFFAPRVEVPISRPFSGGLVDIDRQVIKDFFTHAGARDVQIVEATVSRT